MNLQRDAKKHKQAALYAIEYIYNVFNSLIPIDVNKSHIYDNVLFANEARYRAYEIKHAIAVEEIETAAILFNDFIDHAQAVSMINYMENSSENVESIPDFEDYIKESGRAFQMLVHLGETLNDWLRLYDGYGSICFDRGTIRFVNRDFINLINELRFKYMSLEHMSDE